MIPQQLKQIFGLNSQKDMNMANNIWKMLDEMAESSPEQYKEFIQKNLKEGVQEVKQKKQEKEKPFKIKPEKGFLMEFDVILNQKYIPISQQSQQSQNFNVKLQQKLSLNTQKWEDVKSKFYPKIHVLLNVCYSDRVKIPTDKNKKQMYNLTLDRLKQIEVFYYSLQGQKQIKKEGNQKAQFDYCMIINKNMYESLMRQGGNGKKMIMSLCISYFEQRLQTDLNPLLRVYNPELYKKLAFYAVEKTSIQINSDRNYFYNLSGQMEQFLLQREIDIKRQKQVRQEEDIIKQKMESQKKKVEIKFRSQQKNQQLISRSHEETKKQNNLTEIKPHSYQQNSKLKPPLIQVLNETQSQQLSPDELPYQITETDQGYQLEILTPGVTSIQELDLAISDSKIKLKMLKGTQNAEILLNKPINSDSVKAKLKKKTNRLVIEAPFLHRK